MDDGDLTESARMILRLDRSTERMIGDIVRNARMEAAFGNAGPLKLLYRICEMGCNVRTSQHILREKLDMW